MYKTVLIYKYNKTVEDEFRYNEKKMLKTKAGGGGRSEIQLI